MSEEKHSRSRRPGRRALIVAVLAFAAMQAIPVPRTNPPVVSDVDAPEPVASILHRACYDCHSNETRWPWYSRVAPSSWLVAWHVHEARDALNFSDWPSLDFAAQDLAFGDIRDEVSKGDMPLRSYLWIHGDARLTQAERDSIVRWAGGD